MSRCGCAIQEPAHVAGFFIASRGLINLRRSV
ncbi:PEP-CTERM sorting domain-containing protein [Pseudomonas graminis]